MRGIIYSNKETIIQYIFKFYVHKELASEERASSLSFSTLTASVNFPHISLPSDHFRSEEFLALGPFVGFHAPLLFLTVPFIFLSGSFLGEGCLVTSSWRRRSLPRSVRS